MVGAAPAPSEQRLAETRNEGGEGTGFVGFDPQADGVVKRARALTQAFSHCPGVAMRRRKQFQSDR